MTNNSNDLGKTLKHRRLMMALTVQALATAAAVSPSHLGRIERGERFPSATILRRIAKPLGFGEGELFTLAGYLSPHTRSVAETGEAYISGGLDAYVAGVLASESVTTQRAVVGLLSILKAIGRDALVKDGYLVTTSKQKVG